MNSIKIQVAAVLVFVLLSGCGGEKDSGAGAASPAASNPQATASPSPSVSPSPSPSPVAPVVWPASTASAGEVTIVSADNVIAADSVVTFGQVFAKGDMASASAITAKQAGVALPTQVDLKRLHEDGSIRHAVISVRLPAASRSIPVQITSGSAATGAQLGLDAAKAAAVDYQVRITETTSSAGAALPETGKQWSVSLKEAMASNASSWLSGPLVSEWRSVGVPKNAGAPHPNLRVMFDARFHSALQGRVSIAVENTLTNSTRGDRSYHVQILDSTGNPVFSQNDVVHFGHSRWRKVFYFGGAKELMAIADLERLKASRAIPNYVAVNMPEDVIAARYAGWQATARGLYQYSLMMPGMPGTGGREDIGPLPGWAAAALVSRDARLYQVMFDQAERAGNWAIHYRKPATQDVYSIDANPTITLISSAAAYSDAADKLPAMTLPALSPPVGVVAGEPDCSHQPSLAYVPYLLTGDYYYLEELRFWNAYNLISFNFAYRDNAKGLVWSEQIRGQAWTLRTMGHGAWIVPDSDWQKSYLTEKITNNMNWYRSKMMPNNALGYWSTPLANRADIIPFPSPEVKTAMANGVDVAFGPWMHNFMAYTLFELSERGLGATDVRDYALGFSVRLFTSGADYNKFDGIAYYLAANIGSNAAPVYLNTMADLHRHSFSSRPAADVPTTLDTWYDPNGYAAIALATMAGALDAGVPKANDGYLFVRTEMMNHENQYRLKHVVNPLWNIVPRGAITGLTEAPGIYQK